MAIPLERAKSSLGPGLRRGDGILLCFPNSWLPDIRLDDLLAKATSGVDPGSPGATWRIFENIMALMPWWPLFWFTLVCVVVGAALGWWRGRVWLGIGLALVLGPIGWFTLWMFPRGARVTAQRASSMLRARRR